MSTADSPHVHSGQSAKAIRSTSMYRRKSDGPYPTLCQGVRLGRSVRGDPSGCRLIDGGDRDLRAYVVVCRENLEHG
jgi:hypothetical protein